LFKPDEPYVHRVSAQGARFTLRRGHPSGEQDREGLIAGLGRTRLTIGVNRRDWPKAGLCYRRAKWFRGVANCVPDRLGAWGPCLEFGRSPPEATTPGPGSNRQHRPRLPRPGARRCSERRSDLAELV